MPQLWKPMTTNWYNRNDFINNHRYYRHHCYYYYYYCGPLGLIIDQLWSNNNLYVCNDPEILYPWSSKTREVLAQYYWEIHPRHPRDSLRPRKLREILRLEGMDFSIHYEFWWRTDILSSSIFLHGVDQEILPCGQGRIDSVKSKGRGKKKRFF